MKPKIYIIIANWNGLVDTLECLGSLTAIKYPNYQVIVIDNGSNESEAITISQKFPQVHLIKNSVNTGFVIANNQGIELALKNSADYVLLLNNDTVVTPDFLDILVSSAESNPNVSAVSPQILYYQSPKIWSLGGHIHRLFGISQMIGKGQIGDTALASFSPDFLTGCALLVKTSVIRQIGFLDPIYFAYYEDADWSFKMTQSGFKLLTVPQSLIYHKKSATAGFANSFRRESAFQSYYITRNGLIFFKRYFNFYYQFIFAFFRFFYILLFSGFKNLPAYFRGLIQS